jgi:hypothetical protein
MANTKSSLETAFRYVQEKKLNDLKPNSSIVYDMAPMKEADKLGRKYLAPVVLSYELGFTFGDGSAFSYEDDVAGVYDEIEIDPNPVVLKSRLSIEAADRMANSDKAMISHVALRAGQMKSSLLKMAEIELLHGRVGVGVISGNPSVNTSPTPDQGTIIFTAASWCPGVWTGMIGAKLECRNGATKVNANGDLTLVSVDYDNRTIVVSGDNTDLTDLADGYSIYFKGAYSNGQYGIKYQLDTSGSIFGIDNSAYDLWKAQEHNVAGALTMSEVLKGRTKAVTRGGLDEDCVLLVSGVTFENLNADLSALKMSDSSYKSAKGENGHQSITYHGQGGSVEIVAHPMMKEGEAFMLPKSGLKRVGSTDITFKSLGGGEDVWQLLEGSHAYQIVGRFSFQVLISQPAKCVLFTGIVNS